ncbi:MAG: leucine--tRNA ligase, partial [Candidatus Pacebacteria bacterium]|nr:leucine--tRNA ligase [Candidatus Paceibacterota bacterium]
MARVLYNHTTTEEKWQKVWSSLRLFQGTHRLEEQQKEYLLFAFAYPSGSGLHVGHVESKTALDIMARFKRMNGKNVYFPVGWDAFGLPAENYAIKTGVHPAETTKTAINTFHKQIKRLGISYDWENEIATSHPEYYRWTQWLFLQLYNKGLAYQGMGMVNWCPSCQTVLANEQVVNGECERCDSEVEQRDLKQWYFKITQYKDELLSGLDKVDWPNPTKQQQKNWIGKSEGTEIDFQIKGQEDSIKVFTTAHDTLFGCTFMVVAPEHEVLQKYKSQIDNYKEIDDYIKESQQKTELDRQVVKDKTGVLVKGLSLINPINKEEISLYVADYVLSSYGTGAVMAVPGNDARDNEFAKKYKLKIIPTAKKKDAEEVDFIDYPQLKQFREDYVLTNSGEFDGLNFTDGREQILKKLIDLGAGKATTQYKLRDWLISRQRYWGAPIPVVYDPEGNPHPVKEEHLPWKLPTDVDFKPTGESPLRSSKEFIARTEKLYGKGWRPEFDTMDTFVDSSWYFLRYCDSRNKEVFADKKKLASWLPVDLYLIGPEHIVLHLLYSRFFTKFLRDEGYLTVDEPFSKMRHQGMILGPDGKKMSKSKGNVLSPDKIIEEFGADTLRVYEMFMGPLEADKPWDTHAVAGVSRFLRRIYRLVLSAQKNPVEKSSQVAKRKLHQTLMKVTKDIPQLKFNTSIAMMMECVNVWESENKNGVEALTSKDVNTFVLMLAPFAPFLAEELYDHCLKNDESTTNSKEDYQGVHVQSWPKYDEDLAKAENISFAVQINGK